MSENRQPIPKKNDRFRSCQRIMAIVSPLATDRRRRGRTRNASQRILTRRFLSYRVVLRFVVALVRVSSLFPQNCSHRTTAAQRTLSHSRDCAVALGAHPRRGLPRQQHNFDLERPRTLTDLQRMSVTLSQLCQNGLLRRVSFVCPGWAGPSPARPALPGGAHHLLAPQRAWWRARRRRRRRSFKFLTCLVV